MRKLLWMVQDSLILSFALLGLCGVIWAANPFIGLLAYVALIAILRA